MRAFWEAVSLEMAGISSDSRYLIGDDSPCWKIIEQGVLRWFGNAQLLPFLAGPEVSQMARLRNSLGCEPGGRSGTGRERV